MRAGGICARSRENFIAKCGGIAEAARAGPRGRDLEGRKLAGSIIV
jgi:hypothetical protein